MEVSFMKIDLTRLLGINRYQQQAKNNNQTKIEKQLASDEIEISAEGIELLKQQTAEVKKEKIVTNEVNSKKLNEIKQEIENGTYHVPADQVAAKIIAQWQEKRSE